MKIAVVTAILAVVILGAAWAYFANDGISATNPQPETLPSESSREAANIDASDQSSLPVSTGEENLVEFRCDASKSITAVFARNIVGLTLSDGRQMELRQYMVGSDIRFVNADETVEFRGQGEGGALIEGGQTTFANCVAMI